MDTVGESPSGLGMPTAPQVLCAALLMRTLARLTLVLLQVIYFVSSWKLLGFLSSFGCSEISLNGDVWLFVIVHFVITF